MPRQWFSCAGRCEFESPVVGGGRLTPQPDEPEHLQQLEGDDAVLEWVKGTGLRPILNGLGDAQREIYPREYSRRLREAYPMRADGRTLYPFRGLFIVAAAA